MLECRFQILPTLSRDQLLCAFKWVLGWEWDGHTHNIHTLGKDRGQTRKHRSCPKCFTLTQRTGSVGCVPGATDKTDSRVHQGTSLAIAYKK